MASIKELPIGTYVMAPVRGDMHKAIVIDTPVGHLTAPTMVSVEFTPPVKDCLNPNNWIDYLTCEADQVEVDLTNEATSV